MRPSKQPVEPTTKTKAEKTLFKAVCRAARRRKNPRQICDLFQRSPGAVDGFKTQEYATFFKACSEPARRRKPTEYDLLLQFVEIDDETRKAEYATL
ncbi:hypothetical protein AVEN_266018-1 [Araneus ventricosus]|uniref:Uncharacterized protein n=1 Tax=Araneus ventricosus TaxID=182803 RepID=A0A4Y2X641_ARAVE|nr:hypothetical protein AVEN_266018-1 [Araneus ventricosus]